MALPGECPDCGSDALTVYGLCLACAYGLDVTHERFEQSCLPGLEIDNGKEQHEEEEED